MAYPAGFWPPGYESAADSVDLSAVQFSIGRVDSTLEERVLKVKKYGVGTETITDFATHIGGQVISVTKNDEYDDSYDDDAHPYIAHVLCNPSAPRAAKQVLVAAPDQNVVNFIRRDQVLRFINTVYNESEGEIWHAFEVMSS